MRRRTVLAAGAASALGALLPLTAAAATGERACCPTRMTTLLQARQPCHLRQCPPATSRRWTSRANRRASWQPTTRSWQWRMDCRIPPFAAKRSKCCAIQPRRFSCAARRPPTRRRRTRSTPARHVAGFRDRAARRARSAPERSQHAAAGQLHSRGGDHRARGPGAGGAAAAFV
jgi:hypothetical protein